MLVNLKIPDETYETFARRNPDNPRLELERTLQAFAEVDPRKVNLLLNQEELAELSKILGLPVQDFATLRELLVRSQRASFGDGIEIQLNSGQRNRLEAMSKFHDEGFKSYATREIQKGVVIVVGP